MKRLSLLLLCVGFLPTNYSYAQEAAADWAACPPTLKGAELTKWRKTLIQKVIEESGANTRKLANGMKDIQAAVKACFDGAVPACYSDMDYYIDSQTRQLPNVMTYQDKKDLTLKAATDLPAEFLPKGSEDEIVIPKDILKLAKKKGWKVVSYKTRSTGGFDRAPNLFMIAISTPEKDIFLQTSPHPDKNDKSKNNPVPKPNKGKLHEAQQTLTVITVDKTQDPPVGQMRKLHRYGNEGYRWSNEILNSSCTSCHSLPLKPIAPLGYKHVNGDEQRMSPEQEAQVDAMNYLLKQPVSWGTVKVGDKEKRLGPPIHDYPFGWEKKDSITREDEFLKECASASRSYTHTGFGRYNVTIQQKDPSTINYRKVAEAMSCTQCHDNANRGKLHENFARSEIAFKILIDKTMPPNATLTDDERLALFNCLQAEQNALMKDWKQSGEWMTGASCFGDQFKGNPPKNYTGKAAAKPEATTDSTKAVHQ
jgi:hypothetical protein